MRALAIAAALSFFACGPATTPVPPVLANTGGTATEGHVLMATLERTMCFGWCPVYKVAIYRDGAVEYVGEAYVKTRGPATGRLGPDQIAKLDALFARAHYFDLKAEYTSYEVTDMPSSNTSYTLGDRRHAVQHYHGDRSAPAALGELEGAIDGLVGIQQWIGTEEERSAQRNP